MGLPWEHRKLYHRLSPDGPAGLAAHHWIRESMLLRELGAAARGGGIDELSHCGAQNPAGDVRHHDRPAAQAAVCAETGVGQDAEKIYLIAPGRAFSITFHFQPIM